MIASRNRWLRSKFESRRSGRTCWQTIDRSFCWRATQASICHERRKACIAGLEPDRRLSPDEQLRARNRGTRRTHSRNRSPKSPLPFASLDSPIRCSSMSTASNRPAWPAAGPQSPLGSTWRRLSPSASQRGPKTRVGLADNKITQRRLGHGPLSLGKGRRDLG
jgi:hypothetical protein